MDQAVARALGLLGVLAREAAPMRMSALASQAGLQKSTAHRLLQTLIALGYVEQEAETGRYGPSLKLWEMGSSVVAEHPVRRMAASFLHGLHKTTGETVSLLVRSGDDVLYLDKIISPRAVDFSTRAGSRAPAPLTAGGKAILARSPDAREVAERVASRLKTRRLDVAAFMGEIEEIQTRGYSINRFSPGAISFGCALPGKGGVATAAFSVSAPTERLVEDGEARLVEALLAARARLAETVGYL